LVGWLDFNIPFQQKYGYIRDEYDESGKQSLYPDGDPDRHQNLIICLLAHFQPSLKISSKSVSKVFTQSCYQTDKQQLLHILLGRGNNCK